MYSICIRLGASRKCIIEPLFATSPDPPPFWLETAGKAEKFSDFPAAWVGSGPLGQRALPWWV